MNTVKNLIQKSLQSLGYKLVQHQVVPEDTGFMAVHEKVRPYTMTSKERQHALFDAVTFIEEQGIEGDIVECGVWRGGSSMLAALTLLQKGSTNRSFYMYDTYRGMSEPSVHDVNLHGASASSRWLGLNKDGHNEWDYASLEEVAKNMERTGYPKEKIFFVEGKVEDTIPKTLPNKIALLRLDTDWYESTRHELEHLFPLLVPGGILILDDYGHWEGARKAVDEYMEENGISIFLARIDYTGRIAVKR